MHRSALYAAAMLGLLVAEAAAMDALKSNWLTPAERARLVGLQVITAAYVFAFGATLGSFLNVVIYRLPRGMDIVRPRSRCPACRTPIALSDNIPVLSWLLLRGKCRTCLSPISRRYPLVEAAVGSLLLLLFWLEVRWGGVNLPLKEAKPLDFLSWQLPWRDFLLTVYHTWLLVTLLVMAFIQSDRQRVPAIIVHVGLAAGLLLPMAWPWLRPVPGLPLESIEHRVWWHGCIDGLFGAGLGWLVGTLLALTLRRAHLRRGGKWSMAAALALVGAFLGWQAVVDIGLICVIALAATRSVASVYPRALTIPPLAWVALTGWIYVPLWKLIWLTGRIVG